MANEINYKHMKKLILISLVSFICLQAYSQNFYMPKQYTGRKHRGFYFSGAWGVNSTNMNVDSKNYGQATYKGTGAVMDLKIGGAITEDLILHATILVQGMTGPKINSDYWGINDIKADDKISISQGLIGGGLTYYTPENILLSASLGIGGFTFENEREDLEFSTDNGFSFQLKAGKEWWVSRKLGIGVAVYYQNINVLNQKGNEAEETIKSNSFGVVGSLTFNGRK